ncbi:MAG TPA: zf-HC2 domain-containing protein [Ktedonobacterales bacterium]|nr:zf-HC2 domain-containing protein [Ktedonobacterales bacterium]
MTCRRAHRLLAAYRRDDWSPRDRAALGRHLSSCSACRRVEVSYRGVGESVRQLPSIMPPPGFREAVFAAIRADEQRMGRVVTALTEADTSPELPAISASAAKPPISLTAVRKRRAAWLNPRIALVAAAAVVVFGLLSMQLFPHSGLASLAASLRVIHTNGTPAPKLVVARYMPDAHGRVVTRALATPEWLVYSAADSAGVTTIYRENRQTNQTMPLAHGSATAPATLRAVTSDWAFWSIGGGSSWTLNAGHLGKENVASITLLKSGAEATAPVAINGVWANQGMALVAVTTRAGASQVLQFALPMTNVTPVTVAQTTVRGHALTNPSASGSSIYWAESWRDTSGTHSLIWSRDAAGQAHQMSLDASSFAPHIANGLLIWVEGERGTLEAQALSSSRQQWVVAQSVESDTVRVAGETVLWRAGGLLHTWDARTHTSSAIDAQIRSAAWAETGESSIVWAGPGGSINVYDVD